MRQSVSRKVTLADQSADRYQRFPFELPEGVSSFEVWLEVQGGPDAVVDLGCEGPDGWRGWSGGARRTFIVAEDDATPGYLPGNVVAGTWDVIVGLHTLPDSGAEVTVTVEAPPSAARTTGRSRRPSPGPRAAATATCPPLRGCAGTRATRTPTRCTPTGRSACGNWPTRASPRGSTSCV
ncbi:hypothetical protein G7085_12650 [Tessaracoccus sp. HDW20]|uniref:hypothetical protein n=1 Tax=Tessaracoccus coleopterorum TaxID=2714950 RepID=UPI0018D40818|nr:hypothetical protein [Tessaracoccus coleopterorum]NHB85184.1 hypothetical protein [Tessaracoccus coleopterorum]